MNISADLLAPDPVSPGPAPGGAAGSAPSGDAPGLFERAVDRLLEAGGDEEVGLPEGDDAGLPRRAGKKDDDVDLIEEGMLSLLIALHQLGSRRVPMPADASAALQAGSAGLAGAPAPDPSEPIRATGRAADPDEFAGSRPDVAPAGGPAWNLIPPALLSAGWPVGLSRAPAATQGTADVPTFGRAGAVDCMSPRLGPAELAGLALKRATPAEMWRASMMETAAAVNDAASAGTAGTGTLEQMGAWASADAAPTPGPDVSSPAPDGSAVGGRPGPGDYRDMARSMLAAAARAETGGEPARSAAPEAAVATSTSPAAPAGEAAPVESAGSAEVARRASPALIGSRGDREPATEGGPEGRRADRGQGVAPLASGEPQSFGAEGSRAQGGGEGRSGEQPSRAMPDGGSRPPSSSPAFLDATAAPAAAGPDRAAATPSPDAPTESSPAPVPDLRDQVVRAVRLTWHAGYGEARLRLHPDHLGEVVVEIRVQQGNVSATLRSDAPDVRAWMERHAEVLRAGLAEQGLKLDELVVDAEGRNRRERPRHDDARPARPGRPRPDDPPFELSS